MLVHVLSAILGYLTVTGLFAVLVAGLTCAVLWLGKIPARMVRRGLEHYLADSRRRHYFQIGLYPSKGRIRRQIRRESNALIRAFAVKAVAAPTKSLPRFLAVDPWLLRDVRRVEDSLVEVCPDLGARERAVMAADLVRLGGGVVKRTLLAVRTLTILIATAVAGLWQLNTFEWMGTLDAGNASWPSSPLWEGGLEFYWQGGPQWNHGIGILVTAVVLTFVSGLLVSRWIRDPSQSLVAAASHELEEISDQALPTGDADAAVVGRPGCAVRTLSFAGGAFDSVMQLGVAHALIVIQGRAPDSVVGISAGAVNAVALAEILQAGEDQEKAYFRAHLKRTATSEITEEDVRGAWSSLMDTDQRQLQAMRLLARVDRLRACIDAAQRAPEELFDALLPDPNQIEATQPLHPLQQPRFAPEEREQRADAAIKRTGLVRLYNDLLDIPFSIGMITRVVRRILGIHAASEVRDWGTRWAVRLLEVMRLWVLLGVNLIHAAPLVPILLRAFRGAPRTTAVTAGTLIFRSRFLKRMRHLVANAVWFILLLVLWVGISLLPFGVGHAAAEFIPILQGYGGWVTVLVYAIPVALWLAFSGGLTQFERSTKLDAARGGINTILIFFIVAVGWTLVLVAIVTAPEIATLVVDGWRWPVMQGDVLARRLLYLSAVALVLLLLLLGLLIDAYHHEQTFLNRLLASYSLNDALLRVHGLRTLLIQLFDRNFYRKSSLEQIVEDSLKDNLEHESAKGTKNENAAKLLKYYNAQQRLERIQVGLAVANTSSGELEVVSPGKPVVDALIASLSVTPFFPPMELDGHLYIDGTNVSNEPSRASLRTLRRTLHPDAQTVHIYSVSPFPLSHLALGQPSAEATKPAAEDHEAGYLNLVDVAMRALRLQRLRDATLERRLIELITRAIPQDQPRIDLEVSRNGEVRKERYFRAWVTPIELDADVNLSFRLLGAPKEQRRRAIAETIADGCRAALQVMIADAIQETAKLKKWGLSEKIDGETQEWIAPCERVVEHHLSRRPIPESLRSSENRIRVPGSRETSGPGLFEICRHCRIWREGPPATVTDPSLVAALKAHNQGSLRLRDRWKEGMRGPPWPHEREYQADQLVNDPHFEPKESPHKRETIEALRELRTPTDSESVTRAPWPRPRIDLEASPLNGSERATVSFLFSGGVFRGVYQMGVLNALDQLRLQPDIIAGASVGSITGAMVAETFSIRSQDPEVTKAPHLPDCKFDDLRFARIAHLAAVYLAVDRLILTDRFSDFVRDLTLRAADTQFSVRRADRLFRKYDSPSFLEFDRNARRVVAGLERLLYITPYQLNDFLRDFRNHDTRAIGSHLRNFVQQLLDRMLVGEEILGVEALEDLIHAYVTAPRGSRSPAGLQFDELREQCGIQLLATATNLTEGRLEILGERPYLPGSNTAGPPILVGGLLASSAFPGVFRPRWSSELFPDSPVVHQYIDGGVMDNLPIDAVAQFLCRASRAELIAPRPAAGPHLVVAASLEVNSRPYALATTRQALQGSWLTLRRRAKELKYNAKIDVYAKTEEILRLIDRQYGRGAGNQTDIDLIDLEVVAVKPEWLCGTFAMHPMLGFRRKKQKGSIAHGCASTLLRFGAIKNDPQKAAYLNAWRIPGDSVPDVHRWADAFERSPDARILLETGRCWLRDKPCPFAKNHLQELNKRLAEKHGASDEALLSKTLDELAEIHAACIKPTTHLRPI